MPSITTWNHLATGISASNIDLGLEARIHDPMWMLARQYQLGEFYGEDAGSPISVQAKLDIAPVSRYQAIGSKALDSRASGRLIDSGRQPLEPLVEGEAVHLRQTPTPRIGAETGMRLIRKLRAAGQKPYVAKFTKAFAFTPLDSSLPTADTAALQYLQVMQNRVPDGRLVFTHFAPQISRPLEQWQWPAGITVAAQDAGSLRQVVIDWVSWYRHHFDEPAVEESAWDTSRQAYRFAIAAHDGTTETVLAANDYAQGRLDWETFETAPNVSLGATDTDPGPRFSQQIQTTVPAQLAFAGMPNTRWWELEDSQVDFGGLDGSTDVVRMLFIDYAVSYSNDWFLAPFDIPYGTFSKVSSIVVKDVFGVETTIPAVSAAPDAQGWTMYTLSGTQDGLLLPPVVAQSQESSPIEDVRFVRDEMANMAWGIEYLVESAAGTPFNRHEAARIGRTNPPPTATPTDALKYQLASTVPPHWIPFLPARSGNSTADPLMLVRGEMLPDPDLGGQSPTQAVGQILEPDTPSFRLFEEEVPRAGIRVTRAYQYARSADGNAHLWLGRRKQTAQRGEVNSGLRFDKITSA